jgi:hypothetical protein
MPRKQPGKTRFVSDLRVWNVSDLRNGVFACFGDRTLGRKIRKPGSLSAKRVRSTERLPGFLIFGIVTY